MQCPCSQSAVVSISNSSKCQNKVLRNVCGTKEDEVRKNWRKVLRTLYSSLNSLRVIMAHITKKKREIQNFG
jgi:hypothetical protein